jgi:S-adenosylmethionine hydrolase
MSRHYDTVSLLTDYGNVDEFVGVMKSVLRDLAPHVTTIDLTHGIRAHDVRAGSLALARCIQYVASGVVVAVVDPGVGTNRRAIAIEVAGGSGVLVGPDNGLLAPAVAMAGGAERAVSLTNGAYHLLAPGPTFAGRDVFAPVAAHLCNGVDFADLGELVDPDALLPAVVPLSRIEGDKLLAEVLWVDGFGNAQLNIGPDEIEEMGDVVRLEFHGQVRSARRATTYAELGPGQVGLVIDSYGLVSVCVDRHSAASELALNEGDEITLGPADGGEGVSTPVRLRT